MRMEKSPACLILERKGYRNTLWPEMLFSNSLPVTEPAGLFRGIIAWET